MCPGGWIVPAATEPDGVVVNGMSLSRRDSPFANSGLVVAVEPADVAAAGSGATHSAASSFSDASSEPPPPAGGGELRAPATRLTDFVARRGSTTVPATSYVPGLARPTSPRCSTAPASGSRTACATDWRMFGEQMRGYLTEEAVLVGVESRTSCRRSASRAIRTSLESPDLGGLYPCGEGAGYAGGIVSAALDGIRVARAIARAR